MEQSTRVDVRWGKHRASTTHRVLEAREIRLGLRKHVGRHVRCSPCASSFTFDVKAIGYEIHSGQSTCGQYTDPSDILPHSQAGKVL